MSWLDRLHPQRRKLDALLGEHRFREALEVCAEAAEHERETLKNEVVEAAATFWLQQAEEACYSGDRSRMTASMAKAATFHKPHLGALFRESRWRIRQHTLELTMPPHWTVLLQAAADQRAAFFETHTAPPLWSVFANPVLSREVFQRHPEGADQLERLGAGGLEPLRPFVIHAYPPTLRDAAKTSPPEFLRAACWVALGRPDLAALPLLEMEETAPLVCLERARVAYALGFPKTTMLALGDFEARHGRHVTVRRLNTGVFMAQMAQSIGDLPRATAILARLPLEKVGRRPNLLQARMLHELGRSEEAVTVLERWLAIHPEDEEAVALRNALQSPDKG